MEIHTRDFKLWYLDIVPDSDLNEKEDVENLKELHEKDEPSQVGEALGDDLDYDGGAGETTIGSSIYISSKRISSVDTEQLIDNDK